MTGSVEPSRRVGFLSANSPLPHVASGLGGYLGGVIIGETADGRIEHFGIVGWIAGAATISSLWFAMRVRPAGLPPVSAETISLPAAAEAAVDAGEPLLNAAEEPTGM